MKLILCLIGLAFLGTQAMAQEFEIKKYDLNTRINLESQSIEVTARIHLVNLSSKDLLDKLLLSGNEKPYLSFLLNSHAKVSAMTVNNAAVKFRTSESTRTNTLSVATDITAAIAPLPEFDVELTYSIASTERSSSLHISRSECFFLPGSFWAPVNHTPFGDHGADTAPSSLTVASPAGLTPVSAGLQKSAGNFEQPLAGQPFLILGDYEMAASSNQTLPVEIYAPRGLDAVGKKQVASLLAETERIVAYFAKYFGVPPSYPFRVVSVDARDVTFTSPGAVTLDDSLFRRDTLDLGTVEALTAAVARTWMDGQVLLRGRGAGMLRDAFPVYLTAGYLGERYGEKQRVEAFERYRRAYAPLAGGSDSPLLMESPVDRNYTTSVYNKGAMVWRLIEARLGKPRLDELIRQSLDRLRVDVLSFAEWKSPMCTVSRCGSFKAGMLAAMPPAERAAAADLFTQWIENVVLPDFAIGQPQNTANSVESTVANFGSGDFTVDVIATTASGEKLKKTVTVKAGEYGSVSFPTGTRLTSIEVDPDKLYVQKDYTNDVFPRRPSVSDLYGQASLALGKGVYPTAESKGREALSVEPNSATLQALVGRAMVAQNKIEEGQRLLESALKLEPVPIQAYGWAHVGLGDVALKKSAAAEAEKHFRFGAAAEVDQVTTLAGRDGAIRARGSAQVPEEVRSFIQKLDAAFLQGSSAVTPLIEPGNLKKFAMAFVAVKPSSWNTEILGTEPWDANRIAIDVNLKVRVGGKDYTGRALYVLYRGGGKLLLSEVPIFDVK
jgi:hypothetical protein